METPRSLAEWLRGRADDDLVALLARRPEAAHPVPHDFAVLASRLATRTSVLRALDELDRRRYAVVEALALLPDPTTYDDLTALVGGSLGTPAELRSAVDDLLSLALVWGDDDALRLVTSARSMITQPAGLGPPVASVVARYPRSLYAPLTAALGLPPAKDAVDAASSVEAAFADPATVAARIDAVDDAARAMLNRLTFTPYGSVTAALRPVEATSDVPWQRLVAAGLLVAVDPDTVAVPREVGIVLRGGHPFPPGYADPPALDVTNRTAAAADRTAGGQALTAVTAVGELLNAWGVAPPGVLRSGGLGVRDLRRTARDLDVDEAEVAVFAEVAYAAGLLAPTYDHPEGWLPTPAFDTWLRATPAQRWMTLADAWLSSSRAPGLVGSRDDRDRALNALSSEIEWPAISGIRLAVLEVLAELPRGAAPTVESVVARVEWRAPRRSAARIATGTRWTLAEAELLGVTGAGALSTPGRALVAGDPVGAADALAPLLPEPVDHVLLQADLTAVAPGPLVADLANELRLAADVESKGGATVYRFTEESIRRALDAGRSAAELHALLERRSRTPVPQPLHYLVDDVARRHGRVRVGTAQSYVRSDDPAVLQEILASRRAEPLRLRLLAPTVLAARAPVAKVLEVLRSIGHAPVAESADGAVQVQRQDARRTAARPRPPRAAEPQPLPPEVLDIAVRAIRAGDRAAREAPRLVKPASPTETLGILQEAVLDARAVWIGYLNAEGEASRRMIEPRFIEGGAVVAYDHRTSETRTFLVHRITGIAEAAESG